MVISNGSEEYDRSLRIKDIAAKYETPYQLGKFEQESIAEIERMLEKGLYKDSEQAQEHLTLLEGMENRLAKVLREEQQSGMINETLPEALARIRMLLGKLREAMRQLS